MNLWGSAFDPQENFAIWGLECAILLPLPLRFIEFRDISFQCMKLRRFSHLDT